MNRLQATRAALYRVCLFVAHLGGTSAPVTLARLTGQVLPLLWRRLVQGRLPAG